jgi:hypothetical protein
MLNISLLGVVVGVERLIVRTITLVEVERVGIARLWLVKIQGEIHLLSQGSRLRRHLIPSWLVLVVQHRHWGTLVEIKVVTRLLVQ